MVGRFLVDRTRAGVGVMGWRLRCGECAGFGEVM